MKSKIKTKIRRPVFTALYLLLRPFGKVPVRIDGLSAVFKFRSVDELARAWGFAGEKEVFAGMLRHVQPGDTVWDVGANVGTHAVMFGKKVGVDGTVIAFEPESSTRQTLEENIDLNRLSNIEVLPVALGSTDSTQSMFVDTRPGSGKHSLIPVDGYKRIEVEVRTGDSLGETQVGGLPSVVKIDVEGFELEVLEGMEKTLSSDRCRLVMCEVHTRVLRENGHDPDSVQRMLEAAGFNSFAETPRGTEVHLMAMKR